MKNLTLIRSIRRWVIFFMIALAISGITAFALETELGWLVGVWPVHTGPLYHWLQVVYNAVRDTNAQYPFMAYGYDWLAFAHLVIALVFIGVLRDPVRNIWIMEFAMLACLAVFPLAFICGAIRGIPVYWRLIDCSFGIIGLIPLTICYRKIRLLQQLTGSDENMRSVVNH